MTKRNLSAALAALLLVPLLGGCGGVSPAAQPPAAAAPAQADSLPTIDLADAAKVKQLLDSAKGKVVVVNFWATWCPPCVEETPYFVELHKRYAGKPLEIISLSADGAAAKDKSVAAFQKKNALPFAVHVLASAKPDELNAALGKSLSGALPETLIYDKEGKLQMAFEGGVTLDELETEVKGLL